MNAIYLLVLSLGLLMLERRAFSEQRPNNHQLAGDPAPPKPDKH